MKRHHGLWLPGDQPQAEPALRTIGKRHGRDSGMPNHNLATRDTDSASAARRALMMNCSVWSLCGAWRNATTVDGVDGGNIRSGFRTSDHDQGAIRRSDSSAVPNEMNIVPIVRSTRWCTWRCVAARLVPEFHVIAMPRVIGACLAP